MPDSLLIWNQVFSQFQAFGTQQIWKNHQPAGLKSRIFIAILLKGPILTWKSVKVWVGIDR
ncbi:MAG: hypothetical protein CMJ20_08090 [Phycisphaeraceae bacterium]|nr:hypothetical protein [Phycisphaeraceae bacterium]